MILRNDSHIGVYRFKKGLKAGVDFSNIDEMEEIYEEFIANDTTFELIDGDVYDVYVIRDSSQKTPWQWSRTRCFELVADYNLEVAYD